MEERVPTGNWAERISRLSWSLPGQSLVMSITRDDVSEMQQEETQRGMGGSLGLSGVRAMSMYYGMEWVSHTGLTMQVM